MGEEETKMFLLTLRSISTAVLLVVSIAVANLNGSARANIGVGDYWEYEFAGDPSFIPIQGSLK